MKDLQKLFGDLQSVAAHVPLQREALRKRLLSLPQRQPGLRPRITASFDLVFVQLKAATAARKILSAGVAVAVALVVWGFVALNHAGASNHKFVAQGFDASASCTAGSQDACPGLLVVGSGHAQAKGASKTSSGSPVASSPSPATASVSVAAAPSSATPAVSAALPTAANSVSVPPVVVSVVSPIDLGLQAPITGQSLASVIQSTIDDTLNTALPPLGLGSSNPAQVRQTPPAPTKDTAKDSGDENGDDTTAPGDGTKPVDGDDADN